MANNQPDFERILDVCLESLQTGQEDLDTLLCRYPDQAYQLRPPLEAAAWLAVHEEYFDPRPGFVPASRKRLLERISHEEERSIRAAAPAPGSTGLKELFSMFFRQRQSVYRLALALACVVLVFMLTAGTALAAQSALPGDRLYPVKTATEQVELALALTPAADTTLHIRFAERRLAEIQELVKEGRFERIPETVSRFKEQVNLAIASFAAAVRQDSSRGISLARLIEEAMSQQKALTLSLAGDVPDHLKVEVEQIPRITEASLVAVNEILKSLPAQIPAASQQPVDLPPAAASHTPAPTATLPALPTATPQPSASPTPASAGAGSQATPVIELTPTPSPTFSGEPNKNLKPTPTPTRRVEERPTKRPKPTKPPKPPKPPKPTRLPKPIPN